MSSHLLKLILGSKTRLKVLKIFLWNPHAEFYLRQLQTLLGEDLTAIRREIAKLHEEKLLSRVDRGNRLYYQINASHPFFAPLRELFYESEGVVGAFVKLLSDKVSDESAHERLDHFFLYGDSPSLLESPSWNLFFVGELSSDKLAKLVFSISEQFNKNISHRHLTRLAYDEKMSSDALDDIFMGSVLELKRDGVYL